mgnify:FL=1
METLEESWLCSCCACSYRTYEEWKHGNAEAARMAESFVLTVPMRNGNSTFSSGELYDALVFLPYLWGMETPYLVQTKPLNQIVLTVPMRNGNLILVVVAILAVVVVFLPYLWGMETFSFLMVSMYSLRFLPYLWGMETQVTLNCILNCCAFLPYLWGMETRSLHDPRALELHQFLPYLWGMETWSPWPMRCHQAWFLPYLWGMETERE